MADQPHVYENDLGYMVVATSVEDALKRFEEEWCVDTTPEGVHLVPDEQSIEISVDADGKICEWGKHTETHDMRASDWAKREGVGQLCRGV